MDAPALTKDQFLELASRCHYHHCEDGIYLPKINGNELAALVELAARSYGYESLIDTEERHPHPQ